tara:strand:+ start:31 stop:672 length:642 start_codon:yes stop_codon:yes gene_type:complete
MTSVIVIEKGGVVKEVNIKLNNKDNITNRYSPKSKSGKSGYDKKTTWSVKLNSELYIVELWATDKGRAGSENKYDFPPPVDNELYFGNCLLLRVDNDGSDVVDLTKENWDKIYEKLFGGFEDIGSEEPSEDELESVPEEMKTKSGYLKDGFVVDNEDSENSEDVNSNDDDDDDDDDDDGDNYNSEEEEEAVSSDDEDGDNSELDSEDYDYGSD